MAGSKDEENQKPETNFVDDLDSMLNVDDAANQSVGLIDDDDAIDRLLIDDAFADDASAADEGVRPLDDMDQLIADGVEQENAMSAEFDEFGDDIDDLIADIQINPKQQKTATLETPVMQETESVVDEFADEEDLESVASLNLPGASEGDDNPDMDDVLENMAEIDEFSDEAGAADQGNTDFLMADFDISTDDELEIDEFDSVEVASSNDLDDVVESEQPTIESEEEGDAQQVDEATLSAADDLLENDDVITVETDEIAGESVQTVTVEPEPEKAQPNIDYAALIAGVTSQIAALKKQQAKIEHDIQVKGNKEELTACLESIDVLRSEQKKAKRSIDELNKRKPVSAYVANGLAILALIVGGSLGYQGYQAKNQAAQIIEYLGKMQAQINAGPSADSAEKELLRNQLDELARADSIASEQIAELTKAVQGDGSGKAAGGQTSQPGELMQMGAAIESLQAKVAALEKGKVSAPAVKPVQKKPPVIQENWVVNLVAFKQDWYAKRKAEEFAGKGVPAKVNKAESKGETWYRLSVDGFKSQYEAAAYAARVKKTLNLDSVWVNKIKN